MRHHFSFTYTQKIQTAHPLLEVEVVFMVDAEITDNADETVAIKTVAAYSALDYAVSATSSIPVTMPDESKFEGAKFWALLREAGRNHFYKMQKNETGN